MNENDIIKALECCMKPIGVEGCRVCPLCEKCNDDPNALQELSLDLIKRQQAEIEKLKVREYRNISKTISNARIEGIEDFAEKLKEKGFSDQYYEHESIVYAADIDDLVKEMKEDEHD